MHTSKLKVTRRRKHRLLFTAIQWTLWPLVLERLECAAVYISKPGVDDFLKATSQYIL